MRFKIYYVENEYLEYLRQKDPKVPQEHEESKRRPFIGILLSHEGIKYIIPLTSPKKKHKTMKNTDDFLKINHGIWGALNFNNMIPVCQQTYHQKDVKLEPDDSYKELLKNQLTWININENKEKIIHKAISLIKKQKAKTLNKIIESRCCNFQLLELMCKQWAHDHLNIILKKEFQAKEFVSISNQNEISSIVNINKYGKYSRVENLQMHSNELHNVKIYARDEFDYEKSINVIVKVQQPLYTTAKTEAKV